MILTLFAACSTVLADCTWPYCYHAGSYFYACESTADCLRINGTYCETGLESPTPSGTLCAPWPYQQEVNITYVTVSFPLCMGVMEWLTIGVGVLCVPMVL